MDYQLIRFKIDDLNDYVRSGLLALPDFQRDFVWTPPKVVDLMQSIGREWPIGSLLLLEGPTDFASKSLDQAPEAKFGTIKYLLLDGQQRITSIYHAVQDVSEYVYYIDLSVLIQNSLDEDFIFYMRRGVFEKKYPTVDARAKLCVIKISEIYETEAFFDWLNHVESTDLRKAFVKARRNYIYGLNSGVYSVPATVLPSGISFDALAKIFESLNTNAVRLTTSDLLVAANLRKGVNLRNLWSDYQSRDPNIEALDLDLLDVLKICALKEKILGNDKIRGIKQTDLVKVDPRVYERHWNDSCIQLSQAITFASKYLGVLSAKLLPSSYNLLALSFALQTGCSHKILAVWWVSLIVGETFAQSAHTRMLTQVSQLSNPDLLFEKLNSESDKMQAELTAALSKPHASNAYLARGILSLRLALSEEIKDDQFEPYLIGDRIKIVGRSSSLPPNKGDPIGYLQVMLSTKERSGGKYLTSNNDFSCMELRSLLSRLLEKIAT